MELVCFDSNQTHAVLCFVSAAGIASALAHSFGMALPRFDLSRQLELSKLLLHRWKASASEG